LHNNLDDICNELFSCPQFLWLLHSRRHKEDSIRTTCTVVVFLKQIPSCSIEEFLKLFLFKELFLVCEEHSGNDGVLNEFSQGIAVCCVDELSIIETDLVAFGSCKVRLEEMQIHLISIKISIV